MSRTVIVLVLALASCAGSPPPIDSRAPVERCDELLARYRATLAAATGACRADGDCAPYGGVDGDAVCGGSTDADTARALAAIGAARDAAGCPRPGYSCPPIVVRCADGRCVQ